MQSEFNHVTIHSFSSARFILHISAVSLHCAISSFKKRCKNLSSFSWLIVFGGWPKVKWITIKLGFYPSQMYCSCPTPCWWKEMESNWMSVHFFLYKENNLPGIVQTHHGAYVYMFTWLWTEWNECCWQCWHNLEFAFASWHVITLSLGKFL